MAPEFGSPSQFVCELLAPLFPKAKITDDELQYNSGLSVQPGRPFVFVQEQGGSTSNYLLQDNPRVEVLCYVYGNRAEGLAFGRAVQRQLWLASFNQTVTPSGHMRRLVTEVHPYRQGLNGLPSQITRVSATYSFGFRSRVPE